MQINGSSVNVAIGELLQSDIYGNLKETWTCYSATISSLQQLQPITFHQWDVVFSGGGFSGWGHQYETLEISFLDTDHH